MTNLYTVRYTGRIRFNESSGKFCKGANMIVRAQDRTEAVSVSRAYLDRVSVYDIDGRFEADVFWEVPHVLSLEPIIS